MLDTNICIFLIKNHPEAVAEGCSQCFFGNVVMFAITYAELEYGVDASSNLARERVKQAVDLVYSSDSVFKTDTTHQALHHVPTQNDRN